MRISLPVLSKFLYMVICMSIGAYAFAQSEGNGFFDEYLFGALHVESYETTFFMPFTMDFREHDDRNAVEASFQISIKKDIVKNISPIGFNIGIAFTQAALWQLYAYSNPFRELNFGPEIYIYLPFSQKPGGAGFSFHGIKLAAAHKSNGLGNENSRSWNRVYLEAPVSIGWFLFIPRVWWSFVGIGNDFYEKDIPRYMGMCDLTVVSQWNKHVLRIYGRSNFNIKNIKAHRTIGSMRLDYSYPIAATGSYFYMQYFFGYGESLIDYNRLVNKIGIGLALSR